MRTKTFGEFVDSYRYVMRFELSFFFRLSLMRLFNDYNLLKEGQSAVVCDNACGAWNASMLDVNDYNNVL